MAISMTDGSKLDARPQKSERTSMFESKFPRAQNGESEALGDLLESYRNYLNVIASSQINNRLGRRVSPSDVVQDTMLAAHRDFQDFRGDSAPQFTAWLRAILSRNLFRAIERHLKAEKRDVRREVSLEGVAASVDASSVRLANILQSDQSTPSSILSREEETQRIVDVMQQLPEHYREVIMLRNFHNLRFEDVAKEMNKTPVAARLLWLRAVKRLKDLYQRGSDF